MREFPVGTTVSRAMGSLWRGTCPGPLTALTANAGRTLQGLGAMPSEDEEDHDGSNERRLPRDLVTVQIHHERGGEPSGPCPSGNAHACWKGPMGESKKVHGAGPVRVLGRCRGQGLGRRP